MRAWWLIPLIAGCASGGAKAMFAMDARFDDYANVPQSQMVQSAEQQVSQSYANAANIPMRKGKDGASKKAAPLVVYLGYLRLEVKRLIEAIDAVTAMTHASGGYIESMGARHVVVRIPAKDFDETMDKFAAIGTPLERRVKALDVTSQFTDTEARLAVAVEARARLLALLEQVKDVEERLKILHEIKRLSEQIESMESTLAALKNLVDYFTISIDLVPLVESGREVARRSPFSWVRGLEAHVVTLEEGRKKIGMTMPKGFVLFEEDEVFRAQSADTSMLRAAVVKNEPLGDAKFWADAVDWEMDGRDEERVESGEAAKLLFRIYRNKDVKPRYYLVAVHVAGEEVFVVEAFFPNEASFALHGAAVKEALGSFEVRR